MRAVDPLARLTGLQDLNLSLYGGAGLPRGLGPLADLTGLTRLDLSGGSDVRGLGRWIGRGLHCRRGNRRNANLRSGRSGSLDEAAEMTGGERRRGNTDKRGGRSRRSLGLWLRRKKRLLIERSIQVRIRCRSLVRKPAQFFHARQCRFHPSFILRT